MRPFFILAPLGVLYLVLLGRLVQLHAYPESLENSILGILINETTLPANRGAIVAHDGQPLVYDRPAFELAMSARWEHRRYHPDHRPKELTDLEMLAEIHAVAIGCSLDPDRLAQAVLDPEITYKVFRRGIDPFVATGLRNFLKNYRGLGLVLQPTLNRVYPLERTYSTLLGIVGGQGEKRRGLSGLETTYDATLRGVSGAKGSQLVTGAFGVNPAKSMKEPVGGSALMTTLDADLGPRVREILAANMEADQPAWNGAIVLDVNTGAVLSLIGLPDYNPADPWAGEDGLDHSGIPTNFSLSIENAIEPGSTFKPFVVGWAVQNKLVSTQEKFVDGGRYRVPGSRNIVENARYVSTADKNPKECLIHSSNVVAVKIGQRIGIPGFQEMFRDFGFWDPVVLGGRASPRGRAPSAKRWKGREGTGYTLPSASFGQGVMINPLRFAACLASLVNGGHRIDPYLVSEAGVELSRSKAMRAKNRTGVENPISEEVSAFLVDAMEGMVAKRLGNPLPIIEGVRWAGKSGTARVPTNHDLNTCTFVAIGPLPSPEILVLVVVKDPKRENPSGTKIAGPMAGEILREALRVRGLLPGMGLSGLDSSAPSSTLKPGFKELR